MNLIKDSKQTWKRNKIENKCITWRRAGTGLADSQTDCQVLPGISMRELKRPVALPLAPPSCVPIGKFVLFILIQLVRVSDSYHTLNII